MHFLSICLKVYYNVLFENISLYILRNFQRFNCYETINILCDKKNKQNLPHNLYKNTHEIRFLYFVNCLKNNSV